MTTEKEVIIIKETAMESLISDAFTFSCLLGSFWVNYTYIGGDGWLSAALFFSFFVFALGSGKKKRHTHTIDSALDHLTELKNERISK